MRLSMSQQFSLLSWAVALLAVLLIGAVVARSTYAIALERARTAAALIVDRLPRGGGQDTQAQVPSSLLSTLAVSAGQSRAARLEVKVTLDAEDANRTPTRFEVDAREALQQSASPEYVRTEGTHLLYARRLVPVNDASPLNSSSGLSTEVAGLPGTVTVAVPLFEADHGVLQFYGLHVLLVMAALVVAMAVTAWFVGREVIAPIQRLCRRAERVSEADVANINAEALRFTDRTSSIDLHRLDMAIKRLLRSIRIQRSF